MRSAITRLAVAAAVVALGLGEAEASSAGRCGGTGGPHSKTLTCPAGQYVVGLSARGGVYVDQVSIACQKIPTSGQFGPRGGFLSAGPGGGTDQHGGFCDLHQAVAFLRLKSGIYLDHFTNGGCNAREGDGWRVSEGNQSSADVDIGGPGGISCTVSCPPGEALYGVSVRYGAWIDSISGQCRK
jgi:hypothetical protein